MTKIMINSIIMMLNLVQLGIFVQSYNLTTPSGKLSALREQLASKNLTAYIIPSEDEHQSEYVSDYDKRRQWITGFTGSSGTAVVTSNSSAVWVDSRYYIQAAGQLDTNWIMMNASEPDTVKIEDWLKEILVNSSNKNVGQNSKFTSISAWKSREDSLKEAGIQLISPDEDLIDAIWKNDRPSKPNSNLEIHDIKYSGMTYLEKIELVKQKITSNKAKVFVVSELDEVAWLFNLRGSDIPLYINQNRTNFSQIKSYLNGSIEIYDYEDIVDGIKYYADKGQKIWVSPDCSYYLYNAISKKENLIINIGSPVRSIKAAKTDTEIQNIRKCQIRDSAARVRHIYWLTNEMKKDALKITEVSSAQKLRDIQGEDPLFKDLSFGTISAVGPNAAIVHYSTDEGINSTLERNKIYLLDAGAQYQDCTTDITRTHHFGTPTSMEKMTYTLVLQGAINLANAIFPPGVYGRSVDIEARAPLWNVGLDYGHGTGHGIGYFLSVHENPPTTSYNSRSVYDEPYAKGMVTSDEPGYYEDGKFGIRLETDLEVVEADTAYHFRERKYLKFDALTLVPFDRNLIDECLLTKSQVEYLNKYNDLTWEKVSPLLSNAEHKKFLKAQTEHFEYYPAKCHANFLSFNLFTAFFLIFFAISFN